MQGGDSIIGLSDGGTSYDTGRAPAVALASSDVVIEVHEAPDATRLFYHVGNITKDDSIAWGESRQYDTGNSPAIAVNGTWNVIEVHNEPFGSDLYARAGHLENDGTISWGRSQKYDTGRRASVALTDDGTVIEVHQSPTGRGLWSNVGRLISSDDGPIVDWRSNEQYGSGRFPSVAVGNDGTVIEVHQATQKNQLWFHYGSIRPSGGGSEIEWGYDGLYDEGYWPTVAMAGGRAVEAHKSSLGSAKLWYHVMLPTGF